MKFMYLICMTILYSSAGITNSQNKMISNVPDNNQPPHQTLPSTTNTSDYCSPFAALNIIAYWKFEHQNAYAYGAKAGLQPALAAEYIGHAVTGVGYLQYNGFHVIVHDNWPATHRAVCLPWQNWQGTLAMDPTRPRFTSNLVQMISHYHTVCTKITRIPLTKPL